MAPIKFEDKLKDKLENRTLMPSPDSWNTLADRLDKEEEKNNNSRFWWLGIAASILGIILVTTQFYKNDSEVKDLPIVVDTQTIPESNTELTKEPVEYKDVISNSESVTEIINDSPKDEVALTSSVKTNEEQKPIRKEKIISQPEITKDVIASTASSKPDIKQDVKVNALSQEELKIIEVVDVIKQLTADESLVSEREIDSLLKQAQREIIQQRIYDESTKTVNADALLQDVEVELDQSFRAKVFDALKSSYNSVKTAVAERRN